MQYCNSLPELFDSQFREIQLRGSKGGAVSRWQTGGDLVEELATVNLPNVFNPYRDRCVSHDVEDAPAIRRTNLTAVINAALDQQVQELWVGLELGRLGGRRTGLALTDERKLQSCADYWNIDGLARASTGSEVKEQTAAYIWRALAASNQRVFLWNVFPFHCHMPDSINNRSHTPSEIIQVPDTIPWIIDRLGVQRVFALGKKAEDALRRARITCSYIRHPGRGGGSEFLASIGRANANR